MQCGMEIQQLGITDSSTDHCLKSFQELRATTPKTFNIFTAKQIIYIFSLNKQNVIMKARSLYHICSVSQLS